MLGNTKHNDISIFCQILKVINQLKEEYSVIWITLTTDD